MNRREWNDLSRRIWRPSNVCGRKRASDYGLTRSRHAATSESESFETTMNELQKRAGMSTVRKRIGLRGSCRLACLLFGLQAVYASAAEPEASTVVTFGDSWSDAGTYGFIFGTTPGSSWSQLFARRYGDDQTAYLYSDGEHIKRVMGGLNYAEGGSRVTISGDGPDRIPLSVTAQLDAHLAAHHGFDPSQTVIVWIGINDISKPFQKNSSEFDAVEQRAFTTGEGLSSAAYARAESRIRKAAREEGALVGRMLSAGARRIVVLNNIDDGITPFQPGLTKDGLKIATRLTNAYNAELALSLPKDGRVLPFDVDALVKGEAERVEGRQFAHIHEDGCANHDYSCGPEHYAAPDADQTYLFAGWGHLTRHGREFIAAAVERAVEKQWP